MAQEIGKTENITVETTTLKSELYIVLRDRDDFESRIMFPASELGDIQTILIEYLGKAYIKDTLKH